MEITIRRAVPADVPAIAANNQATALETEEWGLDTGAALAGARAVLDEPSRGFYLVADAGGAIVGQCMVTFEWSDWRNGEFWWIQSVYVKPDCRRRGVFRRLYRTVEAMADERAEVTGLRLYVEASNAAALTAYGRLGMRPAPYILLERDFAKERAGWTRGSRPNGKNEGGDARDAHARADGEGDPRRQVPGGSSTRYLRTGSLEHKVQ